MQVSNSTGRDTDYKLTSGGGAYSTVYPMPTTQEEQVPPPAAEDGSWQPLRQYRFVEHEMDGCEGPWEVTFRFQDASGVETWKTVFVEHPSAQVLLVEVGGRFEVKVLYPDPLEIAA